MVIGVLDAEKKPIERIRGGIGYSWLAGAESTRGSLPNPQRLQHTYQKRGDLTNRAETNRSTASCMVPGLVLRGWRFGEEKGEAVLSLVAEKVIKKAWDSS